MNLPALIRYFRDCYDADHRKATLWNIFHRSIEHRLFLEGSDDLLSGYFPRVPIDPERGRAAAKAAYLARKEKELVYCSLFVIGRVQTEEEHESICAPLLLHPAKIDEDEDGHLFLSIEQDDRRINFGVLDAIREGGGDEAYADLIEALSAGSITAAEIADVMRGLESIAPRIDCIELCSYPRLLPESQLRTMIGSSDAALQALPVSALAMIPKSVEMRGVLNELSEMAETQSFSAPLRALFGEASDPGRKQDRSKRGRLPAVLSSAQMRVIESVASRDLTLVIGPPGTGKSFTIASLAMEQMSRGRSVLVVSKMNQAVDVVADKIEGKLGIEGCVVRAGRKQYLKDLKNYLQQLLSGIASSTTTDDAAISQLERELDKLEIAIERSEKKFAERSQQEIAWGETLIEENSFLQRLKARYILWRSSRVEPLWELVEQMESKRDTMVDGAARLLQMLSRRYSARALREHRKEFTTFLNAIRARSGGRQEDLFGTIDFSALFRAFPVWLVNVADISKVLPLRKELFDLVIIDEATQCDLASCLPILQRARRVVVAGDPNQLRHLSFLSKSRQEALLQRYGLESESSRLDYREKSLLDFVGDAIEDQEGVIFLNEHFRSLPPIIGFSNNRFYRDALRIMTERPWSANEGAITLQHCDGQQVASGENPVEAAAIIQEVQRRIEQERECTSDESSTIGILSPFRSQVDYITAEIAKALPIEQFEKHQIMVGTSYTFQGEERDIMLMSLAVDGESHHGRLRFIDRPDAFNVAVTRARKVQRLYSSLSPQDVDASSLLGAYLRYLDGWQSMASRQSKEHADELDPFATDLVAALEERGMKTIVAHSIAGESIDIAIQRGGSICGIDLIGYPGGFVAALSAERYRIFRRAGMRIFPLPYPRWVADREGCVEAIEKFIAEGAGSDRMLSTRSSGGLI